MTGQCKPARETYSTATLFSAGVDFHRELVTVEAFQTISAGLGEVEVDG